MIDEINKKIYLVDDNGIVLRSYDYLDVYNNLSDDRAFFEMSVSEMYLLKNISKNLKKKRNINLIIK